MTQRIDVIGEKYGMLTAVSSRKNTLSEKKGYLWTCLCECGDNIEVPTSQLRSGVTKNCGCILRKKRAEDVSGTKINMLTAIRKVKGRENKTHYECLCECGGKVTVLAARFKNGEQQSCGCMVGIMSGLRNKERAKPKGHAARTHIYCNLKSRAKRRGFDFNLTKELAYKLFAENCYYCDAKPNNMQEEKSLMGALHTQE